MNACPYVCNNKTEFGYCKTTVCINPMYNQQSITKWLDKADYVQVVRCRECKHYNAGFECLREGYGIEYPQDWYCADGERKDDEHTD